MDSSTSSAHLQASLILATDFKFDVLLFSVGCWWIVCLRRISRRDYFPKGLQNDVSKRLVLLDVVLQTRPCLNNLTLETYKEIEML